MKRILLAGAIAAALGLGACVTPTTNMPTVSVADTAGEAEKQAELALKIRMEEQARVLNVASRLMTANADLCPDTRRSLGVGVESVADLGRSFHPAAGATMGLTSDPEIDWIGEGGSAAAAGLKSGDVIIAVDGQTIAQGPHAYDRIDRIVEAEPATAEAHVKYRRGTEVGEVVVHPAKVCGYAVGIVDSDQLNAAADGRRIMINRGMLHFVKSDDELAMVLAHELAHDTERHLRAKSANATMGLIGGAAFDIFFAAAGVNTGGAFMRAGQAAGAGYASAAFESEADYVGMYYLARAGYNTSGVEDLWRRMAVENPRSIFVVSDHPASPQRYLAIGKTRDEIEAKRKAGEALLPERRAGRPTRASGPASVTKTTATAG